MFLLNSDRFNSSPTLPLYKSQALNLAITQVGNFGGDARAKLFSAIHSSPPTLPAFFRAYTNCLNTKPLSRHNIPRHNFLQHNALDAFLNETRPKWVNVKFYRSTTLRTLIRRLLRGNVVARTLDKSKHRKFELCPLLLCNATLVELLVSLLHSYWIY